jgi:hypothetical protein
MWWAVSAPLAVIGLTVLPNFTFVFIIFQIRSTTTSNRLTNSTKSRISSIFSSTVDSIGDDDPFDLKASARKFKPIRESIVNTGRLVDIDFAE